VITDEWPDVQERRARCDLDVPQDDGLNIGEAAQRSGVPAKTIRFYEAEGVVPSPARSPAGYRRYTDTDVRRLRLVGRLRRLGLPLPDAGAVAAQAFASECRTYVRDVGTLLERQCAEIDRRVAELLTLRAELSDLAAQAHRVEAAVPRGRLVAECGACLVVDDPRPLSPPGEGRAPTSADASSA
jgi:MerR family copper efflux transcriptional regulator